MIPFKNKLDVSFDGFVEWITKEPTKYSPTFYYTFVHRNYYFVVMEKLNFINIQSSTINNMLWNLNYKDQHDNPFYKNITKYSGPSAEYTIYKNLKNCYDDIYHSLYSNIKTNVTVDMNNTNIAYNKQNNQFIISDPYWKK